MKALKKILQILGHTALVMIFLLVLVIIMQFISIYLKKGEQNISNDFDFQCNKATFYEIRPGKHRGFDVVVIDSNKKVPSWAHGAETDPIMNCEFIAGKGSAILTYYLEQRKDGTHKAYYNLFDQKKLLLKEPGGFESGVLF